MLSLSRHAEPVPVMLSFVEAPGPGPPFDKLRVTICHAEPVPVMLSLSKHARCLGRLDVAEEKLDAAGS
jgi:hypothetical protein